MLSFLKLCFGGKGTKSSKQTEVDQLKAYFDTVHYIKPDINLSKESKIVLPEKEAANTSDSNVASNQNSCELPSLAICVRPQSQMISKTIGESMITDCKENQPSFSNCETSSTRLVPSPRKALEEYNEELEVSGDTKDSALRPFSLSYPDPRQKSDDITLLFSASPLLGHKDLLKIEKQFEVDGKAEVGVNFQDPASVLPWPLLIPSFQKHVVKSNEICCTQKREEPSMRKHEKYIKNISIFQLSRELKIWLAKAEMANLESISKQNFGNFSSMIISCTSLENQADFKKFSVSMIRLYTGEDYDLTECPTSSAKSILYTTRNTEEYGKEFEVAGDKQQSAPRSSLSSYPGQEYISHEIGLKFYTTPVPEFKDSVPIKKNADVKDKFQGTVISQDLAFELTPSSPKCVKAGGNYSAQDGEDPLKITEEKYVHDVSKFTELVPENTTKQLSPLPNAMQDIIQYKLLAFLGKGKFSTVYKVQYPGSKEKFALKIVRCCPSCDDGGLKEIFMLKRSNGHSLLLQYCNSYRYVKQDGDIEYGIVTKFFKGLPLRDYMSRKQLRQKQVKVILLQLGQVAKYIHSLGIIHCNITPDNILINKSMSIKLIGFGLSQRGPTATIACGTTCFAAPETGTYRSKHGPVIYGYSADYYSIGAVFHEMTYGDPPPEIIASQDAIALGLGITYDSGRHRKINCCGYRSKIKKEDTLFMAKLLNFCPKSRPNDDTFLKDVCFNSFDLKEKYHLKGNFAE